MTVLQPRLFLSSLIVFALRITGFWCLIVVIDLLGATTQNYNFSMFPLDRKPVFSCGGGVASLAFPLHGRQGFAGTRHRYFFGFTLPTRRRRSGRKFSDGPGSSEPEELGRRLVLALGSVAREAALRGRGFLDDRVGPDRAQMFVVYQYGDRL